MLEMLGVTDTYSPLQPCTVATRQERKKMEQTQMSTAAVTRRLFVYIHNAYASELDLFRAERVTADDAWIIDVPAGTRTLWRVWAGSRERLLCDTDIDDLMAMLVEEGDSITMVNMPRPRAVFVVDGVDDGRAARR